jgi:hypothetical protein
MSSPCHRALFVLLLAGCVTHHKVTITGNRLREVQATLRATGEAIVTADDERSDGSTVGRREVIRIDQGLRVDGEIRIVRDLIKDCGAGAAADAAVDAAVEGTSCPLAALHGYPMGVSTFDTRNYAKPIGITAVSLIAVATGFAVGCGIACDDGSSAKTASYVTVGVVGAISVGLVAWLVINCATGGGCAH